MENKLKVLKLSRHRLNRDGEGIRTLIGLAGCPLNCRYCINRALIHNQRAVDISIDQLVNRVLQDYCYYIATGGGVTFGGGEPLLQCKSIIKFIDTIRPFGITTYIETSLNIDIENIDELLEKVDKLIIDIKDLDPSIYKNYTTVGIDKLLYNLEYIAGIKQQNKCIIRVPLIENYNTDSNRDNTESKLRQLGYNNIHKFKYIVNIE